MTLIRPLHHQQVSSKEGIPMLRKSTLVATGAALSAALAFLFIGCSGSSEDYGSKEPTFTATSTTGRFAAAGSTFLAPLFSRWSSDYEKSHHMLVNYRPIGSGAALTELKQGLLTFAASDAPLTDAQLKDMPPIVQVPVTGGPVCVTYNLAGLPAPLKLSGRTLADIYAGQIKSWEDAAVARDNPGVKLPHTAITVVHRQDGSGTTSIFTTYVSAASPSWSTNTGHGLEVEWPAGLGENGSKAMIATVKETPGAIGYAELSYAKDANLPVASIQNKAGEFIVPSPGSAALAIGAFQDALTKDFRTPVVDPPASAKGAYPITGLSFILIPKESKLPGEQQKFKDFVAYCLTDGQTSAEEMSYAKLPSPILQQGQALLSQLMENGKPLT
jgi:phosphate transport system substrate-binding protein